MAKNFIYKFIGYVMFAFLGVSVLSSCDEVDKGSLTEPEYLTAVQFMEQDPEGRFSEWLKILEASDFYGVWGARGDYTILACGNQGVKDYLAENGYSDIASMEKDDINRLVKNHTVLTSYESYTFSQGPMGDTTMNGNYLTVIYRDGGLNNLLVNQTSVIVDRDNICTNGILHVLDKPVAPIVDGAYTMMKKSGKYNILVEAMEKTGLSTQLDASTINDGSLANYTVFVEPDEVFKAKGINDINELVNHLEAGDDFTEPSNALYKFLSNHVLDRKLYSNVFRDEMYMTIGGSMVEILPESEIYVNPRYNVLGELEPENSNTLDVFQMDGQSKNAVIHELKDILYVFQPAPKEFVDDICDVPEIRKYKQEEINGRYFSSEDIARWKGKGYIVFKYQLGSRGYNNDFAHCFNAKFGWFEYTTKPILKGKYKIQVKFAETGAGSHFIFVDGEKCPDPTKPGSQYHDIGVYEFKENGTHIMRYESLTGSKLLLDAFIFTPVK
ncbi:lipoprotein [Fulvitalea axinellae]|uniref:Lipoprotein n=1 Tax=Fulvitalea axinellae TaxID=1182444 RepID=A0AAU9CR17_9BACT|nr:lipoprotein [Fulvitalea axinellae]